MDSRTNLDKSAARDGLFNGFNSQRTQDIGGPMTAAETLSLEAEQSVAQIVRLYLEPITAKGISISEIRVMPGEDQYGDPYHHIIVIYSGNEDLLDPSWLNGFKRRNRDKLAKWGVNLTTESYVEANEYRERLEMSDPEYHEE